MTDPPRERWYETFFDDLALDVWQRSRDEDLTREEAGYLAEVLELDGPRRVLDVPCGDGRHAVRLAAAGHDVTGVDAAEENGRRLAARADAAGVSVRFVRADMRELPTAAFDAAYCWGNSFGYFPRAETERFVRAMADALVPGGRLAIDTALAAESLLPELSRQSWHRVDDRRTILLECEYDVAESRLDTTYTTLLDGRVVSARPSHAWIFTSGELVAMAERAGLEVVALHGDLDGAAFELASERLVLVARR